MKFVFDFVHSQPSVIGIKKYILCGIIVLFSQCSIIPKRSVTVGKVSGNPKLKNSVQIINFRETFLQLYPELAKLDSGIVSPKPRIYHGKPGLLMLNSGNIIGMTGFNGRIMFFKCDAINNNKPSRMILLSNQDDTIKKLKTYKTLEDMTEDNSVEGYRLLLLGDKMVLSLKNTIILVDTNLSMMKIRTYRSVMNELKLDSSKIQIKGIQRIAFDNTFIIRNKVIDANKKSEMLIELNDSLVITHKSFLPVLDIGTWYYRNSDLDAQSPAPYRDLGPFFSEFLSKGENKIGKSRYKLLYTPKTIGIDNLFKIGGQYYFINNGFYNPKDSVVFSNEKQAYFINFNKFLDSVQLVHQWRNIIPAEDTSRYENDSVFFDQESQKYYLNYKQYLNTIRLKMIITPVNQWDTLHINYLKLDTWPFSDFAIKNFRQGIQIALLDSDYVTGVLNSMDYSHWNFNHSQKDKYGYSLSSGLHPGTIIFDKEFKIKKKYASDFGFSSHVAYFKKGLMWLDDICKYGTQLDMFSTCPDNFRTLDIFFWDTITPKTSVIKIVPDAYRTIPVVTGLKMLRSCENEVQYIIASIESEGTELRTSVMLIDTNLNINNNDYKLQIDNDKRFTLTIQSQSNGLCQPIPFRLFCTAQNRDSRNFIINGKTQQGVNYSKSLRSDIASLWWKYFKILPDSAYMIELPPGEYFLVTDPICVENKDEGNLKDVARSYYSDKFGRVQYTNAENKFIQYQFKLKVFENGKIHISRIK